GHRRKNRPNKCGLAEKRQDKRYRDALGVRVRYSNGRISQGGGCHRIWAWIRISRSRRRTETKRPKGNFQRSLASSTVKHTLRLFLTKLISLLYLFTTEPYL